MPPAYSTVPLTVFTPRRSHVTSLTLMSPLTDPRSTPRALSPFARTLPLTLAAERSPSAVTPVSETSPDTVLAVSSRCASVMPTLPLTVSARSEPWTPVTLTAPDTEWSSAEADAGSVTA